MVNYENRSKLLKGPTANALLRLRYKFTAVTLVICLVIMFGAATHTPRSWLTDSVVFLLAIPAAIVCWLIVWVPARERAERKAGYTTLLYGDRKLEQRDPYLGEVIRQPGGAYLTPQEFHTIVDAAKEESRKRAAVK